MSANNTKHWGHIQVPHLRRDATFIYSLIDQAVEKANSCPFLNVVLILNQFDQKDIEEVALTDIFDTSDVKSVCVHFACNMAAKDHDTHLLSPR